MSSTGRLRRAVLLLMLIMSQVPPTHADVIDDAKAEIKRWGRKLDDHIADCLASMKTWSKKLDDHVADCQASIKTWTKKLEDHEVDCVSAIKSWTKKLDEHADRCASEIKSWDQRLASKVTNTAEQIKALDERLVKKELEINDAVALLDQKLKERAALAATGLETNLLAEKIGSLLPRIDGRVLLDPQEIQKAVTSLVAERNLTLDVVKEIGGLLQSTGLDLVSLPGKIGDLLKEVSRLTKLSRDCPGQRHPESEVLPIDAAAGNAGSALTDDSWRGSGPCGDVDPAYIPGEPAAKCCGINLNTNPGDHYKANGNSPMFAVEYQWLSLLHARLASGPGASLPPSFKADFETMIAHCHLLDLQMTPTADHRLWLSHDNLTAKYSGMVLHGFAQNDIWNHVQRDLEAVERGGPKFNDDHQSPGAHRQIPQAHAFYRLCAGKDPDSVGLLILKESLKNPWTDFPSPIEAIKRGELPQGDECPAGHILRIFLMVSALEMLCDKGLIPDKYEIREACAAAKRAVASCRGLHPAFYEYFGRDLSHPNARCSGGLEGFWPSSTAVKLPVPFTR